LEGDGRLLGEALRERGDIFWRGRQSGSAGIVLRALTPELGQPAEQGQLLCRDHRIFVLPALLCDREAVL
jgi:hypothetical protein